MGLTQPRRFRINPSTVFNRVGDQIVLVHLETDRIYSLNRTAARLWELINEGRNTMEITQLLSQEFDVTEQQIEKEIETTLNSLAQQNFISIDQ